MECSTRCEKFYIDSQTLSDGNRIFMLKIIGIQWRGVENFDQTNSSVGGVVAHHKNWTEVRKGTVAFLEYLNQEYDVLENCNRILEKRLSYSSRSEASS